MTSRFLVKQNLRFFEFFYPYTAREGVFVCGKSGETGWLRAGQSSGRNGQSDILWRRQRLKCQTPIPPTPALIQKVID